MGHYPVYCCIDGCDKLAENVDTMLCASHGRAQRKAQELENKPIKAPKPIAKTSDKMAQALKIYSVKRRKFLEANPRCEVFPDKPSIEVHHGKGRATIELLLDDNYWIAVSREGHDWIHANPKEAMERGFSFSRLADDGPELNYAIIDEYGKELDITKYDFQLKIKPFTEPHKI